MKLYYAPGACSLVPHIVLEEGGFSYDAEAVDLATKKTAGGADFNAINVKGYVPALILDDGQLLTEVGAIIQYLADQVPEKNLVPAAGTLERARMQEWLSFISTELHKNFSPLYNPASSQDWKDAASDMLKMRFDYVVTQLEGKDFLLGDQYTIADAYLFVVLSWGDFVGFDMSPWPALGAYSGRVASRPAVQNALRAEGLME